MALAIPLFDDPAPPAVRRPAVALAFGATAAEDWRRALVSLEVELGLAPALDAVTARTQAGPPAAGDGGALGGLGAAAAGAAGALLGTGGAAAGPGVAVAETGTVSLGYDDDGPQAVFAGRVEQVRRQLDGSQRLTAVDGGTALAQLRLGRSYDGDSAGAVVRDLAAAAGVDLGTVEDGVDLAFFALDHRRSAWSQIAELARRSGFVARFDAAGALVFAPAEVGEAVQTFTYGVDLLALAAADQAPAIAGLRLVGEGAAGAQGPEAASWLVKDPAAVSAEAGDEPRRLISDPAVRSQAAAQMAAAGLLAAERGGVIARLLVPGAPALRPGLAVAVAGTPEGTLDATYLVRRLRHRYAEHAGFTTELWLSSADAAAGGGLLGALGGLL